MIPIFSIICASIFVINSLLFLKVHSSYKKTGLALVGYFAKALFFMALVFGFMATPRLLIEDLRLIEASLDLSIFCIFWIVAFFLFIPFEIHFLRPPPRFLTFGIIASSLALLVFSLLNIEPANIHFHNNFVFWSESRPLIINRLIIGILGFYALGSALFFVFGALKSENRKAKIRSFLMAFSLVLIAVGGAVRFVFPSLFDIFWSTLIGLIFALVSTIFGTIAILLIKPAQEKPAQKAPGFEWPEKGRIVKKEKGLTIIRLEGNPYEMGYQHGRFLKEEINWFASNARKAICAQEGKIIGRIAFPIIRRSAKKVGKYLPKKYQEEIRGIADGAGVDYSFLVLENLIEEMSILYWRRVRPCFPSFLACSCFVARGSEGIVWGRNLDYAFFTEKLPAFNTLFVYCPSDSHPFLSFGWPGNIGVPTGISENLDLILLSSPVKKRPGKILPEEILTRQTIQGSQDLDIAIKRINPDLITLGENIVLVSKDNAKVVELAPAKKNIRSFDSKGLLVVTNHFQSLEMTEEQPVLFPRPTNTILPEEFFTLKGSRKREKILRALCQEKPIDFGRAKEILEQVSTPGTVQSVICFPGKQEFFVAKNAKPPVTKGEWLNFRLEDLLA